MIKFVAKSPIRTASITKTVLFFIRLPFMIEAKKLTFNLQMPVILKLHIIQLFNLFGLYFAGNTHE